MLLRRFSILFATSIVLGASLVAATPAPTLASSGYTLTAATVYSVDPVAGRIKVVNTFKLTNNKPGYVFSTLTMAEEIEGGSIVASDGQPIRGFVTVETDKYYRYVQLGLRKIVYPGQTSTVTATYYIPAGVGAAGGFRARAAYLSLCAIGQGPDGGSVSVVAPAGYDLSVIGGDAMSESTGSDGSQVLSSGQLSNAYSFFSCVSGENPDNLVLSSTTAGDQNFTVKAWPEDPNWAKSVKADLRGDVPALEALTGLKMPGTNIDVVEVGDWSLGGYAGGYSGIEQTVYLPETFTEDTVAHELAHVWFNHNAVDDTWISEGLAGFGEQAAGTGNYIPCTNPGEYPGTGGPDLRSWVYLDNSSTDTDELIVGYQYTAACYIFVELADQLGMEKFRVVLAEIVADDTAYPATAGSSEHSYSAKVNSEALLDLLEGQAAGASTTSSGAADLLTTYGIFDRSTLTTRAASRSAYETLFAAAGKWKLPPAVRQAMSEWDFTTADAAMATAKQIVTKRDHILLLVPGVSIDGTSLQTTFESARTQAELNAVLAAMTKEEQAAEKVAEAVRAQTGGHSIFQTIGLIGTNTASGVSAAKTALGSVKPDEATSAAQKVIDTIDGSTNAGLIRLAIVFGLLALVVFLILLVVLLRRRSKARYQFAAAQATYGIYPGAYPGAYPAAYPAAYGQFPPAAPPEGAAPEGAAPEGAAADAIPAAPAPVPAEPSAEPAAGDGGQSGAP